MKYFLDVIAKGFNPHDDEDLAITRNLYWCMVESGLGLLAVCLPTMRSFFTGQNASWLTSVKSVFSLRSNRSQPSEMDSKKYSQKTSGNDEYVHLADDRTSIGRSENYAMEDRSTNKEARSAYGQRADEQV